MCILSSISKYRTFSLPMRGTPTALLRASSLARCCKALQRLETSSPSSARVITAISMNSIANRTKTVYRIPDRPTRQGSETCVKYCKMKLEWTAECATIKQVPSKRIHSSFNPIQLTSTVSRLQLGEREHAPLARAASKSSLAAEAFSTWSLCRQSRQSHSDRIFRSMTWAALEQSAVLRSENKRSRCLICLVRLAAAGRSWSHCLIYLYGSLRFGYWIKFPKQASKCSVICDPNQNMPAKPTHWMQDISTIPKSSIGFQFARHSPYLHVFLFLGHKTSVLRTRYQMASAADSAIAANDRLAVGPSMRQVKRLTHLLSIWVYVSSLALTSDQRAYDSVADSISSCKFDKWCDIHRHPIVTVLDDSLKCCRSETQNLPKLRNAPQAPLGGSSLALNISSHLSVLQHVLLCLYDCSGQKGGLFILCYVYSTYFYIRLYLIDFANGMVMHSVCCAYSTSPHWRSDGSSGSFVWRCWTYTMFGTRMEAHDRHEGLAFASRWLFWSSCMRLKLSWRPNHKEDVEGVLWCLD